MNETGHTDSSGESIRITGKDLSRKIKKLAEEIGFTACGIARAAPLEHEKEILLQWLQQAFHGEMGYLARETAKRLDPRLLLEGASSVICLASYYKPPDHLVPSFPFRIARYALGQDYHAVISHKLTMLANAIMKITGPFRFKVCCDTSSIMEKAWAVKSGLGWTGKNTLLIIPGKGSYFLLGEIITDLELQADEPYEKDHCGNCSQCMTSCPVKAIIAPGLLDASKCLSYLTTSFKKTHLPGTALHGQLYGCDICQEVCPYNRMTPPVPRSWLEPNPALSLLPASEWTKMREEDFNALFQEGDIRRRGYGKFREQIMLNNQYLQNND
ncbi:MAG TPA: tRNA epoxyqueuosine(34) reductase QueG [Bacteroidales bacterium]|nr:tRNA epoxyqueuosine(34) reductase QueG [Bacteroidales bacterium]HSA43989.1 tRNA epoxyqueuosine(34) reductase QueG [Bacteroidales bacterium]